MAHIVLMCKRVCVTVLVSNLIIWLPVHNYVLSNDLRCSANFFALIEQVREREVALPMAIQLDS